MKKNWRNMPENNFEKQVQEIFSEMRLKPSADVWPKVHERIKKDNNRRWALLWIPAALLLLSAGGYWLLGPSKDADNSHQLTNTNTVVNEKTANDPSLQKQTSPGNNTTVAENAQPAQQTDKQVTAATSEKENKTSVNEEAASAPGKTNKANSKEPLVKNENKVATTEGIATQQQKNLVADKKTDNNNIVSHSSKLPKASNKNFNARESKESVAFRKSRNNKIENKEVDTEIVINEESADASLTASLQSVNENQLPGLFSNEQLQKTALNKNLATPIKLAKKKTWEFGVSAGAGISALGKGLAKDLFAQKALENNMSFAPTLNAPLRPSDMVDYQNVVGNGAMAAALPPPASPVKTGFAYTVGGFAKWHLSPKFALTGGLEYQHYTTRREVGKAISWDVLNQAPNQYANVRFAGSYSTNAAAAVNNSMYTNEYHYLQLPIGFEWQLNKVSHLPVLLNAGLSLGYMVNTNAVHYGTTTGLYYQDKNLFNDLQGGLYAGVQVKLFNRSRMPLYAGPVVHYNYTSLTKNSSDSKQNFMYAGFKLQWVLATAR